MNSLKPLLLILLWSVVVLVSPSWLFADSKKAKKLTLDQVKIQTPVYRPSAKPDFAYGTYTYEVSWQGIPAAEAKLTIYEDVEQDTYHLIATADTKKWLGLFYKLKYRGEGIVSANSFTPRAAVLKKRENKRIQSTQITFDKDGEISSIRRKKGRDTKVLNFRSDNFTLDPFSASLLAKSLDWSIGTERKFDTFNGKDRFLITLTCVGRQNIEVDGVDRDTWEIQIQVKNLLKNEKPKKFRRASIYLTADEKRDILRIESEVLIGSVVTKLESFQPLPEPRKLVHLGASTE